MEKIATEEAVWQICETLLAEGRKISGRAVQKEIGGSLSTIFPHIEGWKSRNTKCSTVDAEIPVDVQKSLLLAFGQNAKKATEELGNKMEDVEERLKEVMEDLIDREKMTTCLEADLSDAQAEIINLKHLSDKQSAIASETITGLRERINKLEQEKQDLIHIGESARIEVSRSNLQLEYANKSVITVEEKVLEQEHRITELVISKTDAEKGKAVADSHAQDMMSQTAKMEKYLKSAEETISRLEFSLSELNLKLNEALSAGRKNEGMAEQMALRIVESAATNEQLRNELAFVRKEATAIAERMMLQENESTALFNKLSKELDNIRKENAIVNKLPAVEIAENK